MTTGASRRDVARGMLGWTAVVLVLLLVSGLASVALGQPRGTWVDALDGNPLVSRQAYSFVASIHYSDARTDLQMDRFEVPRDAREVRFDLLLQPATGCVAIELRTPSGRTVESDGTGCSPYVKSARFTEPGTWTVRYTFAAFSGVVVAGAVTQEPAS